MNNLVRTIVSSLAMVALYATPALALDTGDIVVVSLKGEVHITLNGVERAVRAGGVLLPPASVRTGRDGSIELKQGATTVSVGPETQLDFPALEKAGGPIDRIVQPKGNAFYDIGKREGRRLRVETPYLVGVIKGTQFNVAAQENATTISLFEGRLEVQSTETSAVVDLLAGEIASRRKGEKTIGVIKMEPGRNSPAARPASSGSASNDPGNSNGVNAALPRSGVEDTLSSNTRTVAATVESVPDTRAGASVDVRTGGADVSGNVSAGVDASNGVVVNAGANVIAGAGNVAGVDTSVNTNLGMGSNGISGNVDAGAAANVGNVATVDTGVGAAVDVGNSGISTNVDLGVAASAGTVATVDTSVGTTVDVGSSGVSTNVDLGTTANVGNVVAVDTGGGAAVDVTPSGVTAGVDLGTTANAGNLVTVDTSANTAVDLGGTTPAVNTAVDVGTTVGSVDLGATVGANLGTGSVDLGLNVGGVNVGIDLGVDDGNNGHGNDAGHNDSSNPGRGNTGSPGNTNTGGLLDSLLGPGKKRK